MQETATIKCARCDNDGNHFSANAFQASKLLVLGVASEERSPIYPSAPTLVEQGYTNVVGYGWFGLMVPTATPQPIVDQLAAETKTIHADTSVKQRLAALGLQAIGSVPAEFASFVDKETTRWIRVIKQAGITGE